jgi:2-(1,2-epoxy-1,2-dihydrophenyl)acetyl-CoA isomerase
VLPFLRLILHAEIIPMSLVLYEKRADGVAVVTLNRPERMNATSAEMGRLMAEYFNDADGDPAVRCLAVTGTGRAFCSGADVGGMRDRNTAGGGDAGLMATLDLRIRELRGRQDGIGLRLHTMTKPTVAIVNGYAIGAGFALACAADIRLAGEGAQFSTGFAKTATSGDGGGTYFLSKLVNSGTARELCFLPDNFSAQRAKEYGIVNHVLPQERLMEEALAFCARIAAGPTSAFARMKENLNLAWSATPKQALDFEAANIVYSTLSKDHREAVNGFMEKRPPHFTGS